VNATVHAFPDRCSGCGATRREIQFDEHGDPLCCDCFIERSAGAAPLPTLPKHNQDQEEEKEKEEDQEKEFRSTTSAVPSPGCGFSADDASELRVLEAMWKAGKLEPVPVQLGELPPHAGSVMRHIAEHLRLRMGLRAAVGDERPLPYALSEAVNAGIAIDKAAASRAIGALVRAKVIDHVGSLPGRLAPDGTTLSGTKLYAPPAASNVVHGVWTDPA
jgi:hypothetical protein